MSDNESTMVVINGAAITAGSSLHFFAINGSKHPVILAIITVTNNAHRMVYRSKKVVTVFATRSKAVIASDNYLSTT